MAIQQTFIIAVFAVSVAAYPARDPRRVLPNPEDPMSLINLQISCTFQGWTICQQMVSNLLNSSHPFNTAINECIAHYSPYEWPTSTPATNSSSVAGVQEANSSSGSGDGDILNSENSTVNTPNTSNTGNWSTDDLVCTVSGEEKKRIRQDVYCSLLFDLDHLMVSIVRFLCLLRDLQCVPHYSDVGYLSPSQILQSILLWHQNMINTHKRCCESPENGRIFTRNLATLYQPTFRAGENAQICNGRVQWETGLSKVGFIMHASEFIQSLGRRKTCLRGCVGQNQVICTTIILSEIFQ